MNASDGHIGELEFSFQDDVLPALRKYLLAVASMLPGFFVGSAILIVWYIAASVFLLRKRNDLLIVTFVLWNFLNRGAYHYGLVGSSESDVLLRTFNTYVLLLLFIGYMVGTKERHPVLQRYVKYGLTLVAIAGIAGVVNGIDMPTLFGYYVIYFRWLIFAFLLWSTSLTRDFVKSLVVLIFSIVGFNSVLGFLQQLVLPIQVTPDGYVPDPFDVASGLLGVTFSQHLTILCVFSAAFFIFRFLRGVGRGNLTISAILLLQPFSSSSKFSLALSLGLTIISLLYLYGKSNVASRSALPKIALVALVVWIGSFLYRSINEEVFGSLTSSVVEYVGTLESWEDVRKAMGYALAATEVAPAGKAGIILGVGPTRFLNTISAPPDNEFASLLAIGNEFNDLSSVEKQNTEMVATIGELGVAGTIISVYMMLRILLDTFARFKRQPESTRKLFSLFTGQFVAGVILLTFYLQGWAVAFYYVPMLVFLCYDIKHLSTTSPAA